MPHLPTLLGFASENHNVLDLNAIIWILIINGCLLSQQVLNNKTVQTALTGVGPNALVLWRVIFISSAIFIIPIIGNIMNANMPDRVSSTKFETRILSKVDESQKSYLLNFYGKSNDDYVLKSDVPENEEVKIKEIIKSTEYHQFFSLFDGSIIPDNWLPILFVIAAGLTGYIYSFGFFKLSKFSAHFWVPYTNLWLALLPFVMLLFGKNVTVYQIIGAVVVTAGLMVGVMDHRKNKVEEIERKK